MTATDILRGEVALRNLSKSYSLNGQSLPVLRNLSLNIRGGEALAIVGPRAAARPRCCGCWPGWSPPMADRF